MIKIIRTSTWKWMVGEIWFLNFLKDSQTREINRLIQELRWAKRDWE